MENEYLNEAVDDVRAALSLGDKEEMIEALSRVERMFSVEDRGWKILLGNDYHMDEHGPTLEMIKKVSEHIREEAVGNPLIKRALGLRKSYVFSKGVNIPGYEFKPTVTKRGRPSQTSKFFSNKVNQRYLIDPSHREMLEQTAFTDGVIFHLGDDKTKTIRQIPIWEIAGIATHPDYPTEVIAIKREWTRQEAGKQAENMVRWYYVDQHEGDRAQKIDEHLVERDKTMFIQNFNAQSGWLWGVPDALTAVVWSRIYTELMNYGRAMTKTLAQLAAFMKSKNPKAGNQAGKAIAANAGGGIASIGEGQELAALATAGKTYDFEGLRPIASMVATGVEVSVIHLLSDPGAAGSSYGSAQNLDLPTKRAIVMRQDLWASYLERILEWGTGEREQVTFPLLDEPDLYREVQTAAMAWNTGTIHPDEIRGRMLAIAQLEPLHDAPPEGAVPPTGESSVQASAPDQGQSNGTGGQGNLKNDSKQEN